MDISSRSMPTVLRTSSTKTTLAPRAFSQAWTSPFGTTDGQGNFTATVVTSDSIRNGDNSATVGPNGVEVTTGGKTCTGEYFENPDSIKMENVNGKSTFVDHNQITLGGKAGSGLENF